MSQSTKIVLEQSLKELLSVKPLNKITIGDLTEAAGISRMTFYYHFQDIYELIEWTCQHGIQKALKGKKTYDTWQEGMLNIFNAILANRAFVMNVYNSISREQIEKYLYTLVYTLLYDVVNELAQGRNVSTDDQEKIAQFYKYAFVGIMIDWIKSGMKQKPEDIINHLSVMIHGSIERSVINFAK